MVEARSKNSGNKESERDLENNEIKHVLEALKSLTDDEDSLQKIYEMARFSLETVTHLTEYEDEKANRVLTAVTFLSALAAVVFSAFIDKVSPTYLVQPFPLGFYMSAIVVLVYVSFAVYCIQVVLGAALTLSAVRPQFNIPSAWRKPRQVAGPPSSFLFFDKILEAGGKNWGVAFTSTVPEIKREYTRNCILETFLISQKIRHKLKPLQKGIKFFWLSSFTLLVFLVSSIVALTGVRVPRSTPEIQTQSSLVTGKDLRLPFSAPAGLSPTERNASDQKSLEQKEHAR